MEGQPAPVPTWTRKKPLSEAVSTSKYSTKRGMPSWRSPCSALASRSKSSSWRQSCMLRSVRALMATRPPPGRCACSRANHESVRPPCSTDCNVCWLGWRMVATVLGAWPVGACAYHAATAPSCTVSEAMSTWTCRSSQLHGSLAWPALQQLEEGVMINAMMHAPCRRRCQFPAQSSS